MQFKKYASYLWFILGVIVLDQFTKELALSHLRPYRPLEVMSFFNLTLSFNTGAAFSFLSEAGGWQRWFFVFIGLVLVPVLLNWMLRSENGEGLLRIGLSLIIGGAIGNIIDRVMRKHGAVVDFLDFYIGQHHWPAFNVADSAICIGAAILIWVTFATDVKANNKNSEN